MFSLRFVPTVLFGFTILACSQSQESVRPPVAEDLAAIADAGARLKSAMSLDDVPGIMAELAEDHLTMPPDGPTPPNDQVLAEWHQARMDQFTFESVFTTDEVRLLGDFAIERFSGSTRLVPREGGDDVVDSTKGVWIWERQEDGSWKILWSIWNSNLPAEANWQTEEGL